MKKKYLVPYLLFNESVRESGGIREEETVPSMVFQVIRSQDTFRPIYILPSSLMVWSNVWGKLKLSYFAWAIFFWWKLMREIVSEQYPTISCTNLTPLLAAYHPILQIFKIQTVLLSYLMQITLRKYFFQVQEEDATLNLCPKLWWAQTRKHLVSLCNI